MARGYRFSRIEKKWQRAWDKAGIFEADPDPEKPKYFITVAYPYVNSPQHIGHGRTYTLADVHARYMRMRGYNVLFPMAFHYTGTPILAMSKRLISGDEELIDTFKSVFGVPSKHLKEFVDPLKMGQFFHKEIRSGMREMGYSIDWRREFTTIDPPYNRFIEWQFRKLREAGFISQGSHPVGWCPSCGNPVGQHDTRGDVEPEIDEFILIRFEHEGWVLPAATLRPETIFGVTNIWLNPGAEYVEARVDGERWILSKHGSEKLRYLNHKVEVVRTFLGRELIGAEVRSPMTNARIPIFPAEFVDPKNATGVVMSVPGHAPFDYVALENLKAEKKLLKEYELTREGVEGVKPISLIFLPGYSEFPASDAVLRMGIKSQLDPRLEDATKEIYRHEFHNGRMKENTGKYAGLSVAEAKEEVKEDMIREGTAGTMYELVKRPVFCRCGAEIVVKIFEDQWFINYGNSEWKALAHRCLARMEILPEEMRQEFGYVVDWLHDKACARKSGLGTKLPWDPEWIIESLSDSVIYMAYYTIAKEIRQLIASSQLSDALFDYLFLGKGSAKEVAKEMGVSSRILKGMRDEFSYFYPLDSRHSGRDLVPNHLTFMVFVHTAIFPERLWPNQIVVNGSVLMEGQKMSKSLGNIIPLRKAIGTFGADPLRLALLATADQLHDVDFSPALARSMGERLQRLYKFALSVIPKGRTGTPAGLPINQQIDRWMLSRLQEHIKRATEAMDKLMVRKAVHNALFLLNQDVDWYQRRVAAEKDLPERKGAIARVLGEVIDAQVRMLAPIAPHLCEEIWSLMGREGFVSLAEWPHPREEHVDIQMEVRESLVKDLLEDTSSILQTIKITPSRICYYIAAPWKWKVYIKTLDMSTSGELDEGKLMRELMRDPELKRRAGEVRKFSSKILDDVNRMPDPRRQRLLGVGAIDEGRVLMEAKNFLQERTGAMIDIYGEDEERYDPKNRAHLARPYRPAIFVE
ncbi:MAG: leucine--tRNA ligase [Candidatus Bathyarchaeia archaeon]